MSVFQTIISAMSILTPPMPLSNPDNQFRVDYIKNIAPLSDFEYTEVTHTHALSSLKASKASCVYMRTS